MCAFKLTGCERNPNVDPITSRQVVIFFNAKSISTTSVKSTADEVENSIKSLQLFGVDDKNNVIQSFPIIENPSPNGTTLTLSRNIKSLYAIANPSSVWEQATSNVSELMNLTCDYTNTPQSPFLMGGKVDVYGYNVNIELIRSIAKIVVNGVDGFEVQSVTVKNTPSKGFVFAQTPLTIPSSGKVNYPETANTTLYVAENIRQNPTTLTVKGIIDGKTIEKDVEFYVGGTLVNIERNKCYQVTIAPMSEQDCNISISIVDWVEVDVDTHYFEY